MKPYGMHDKRSGVPQHEDEDSRRARRWSLGNRSVTPVTYREKIWKKRARAAGKKVCNEACDE